MFQPGNRTQCVFPPRAIVYVPNGLAGGAGTKTINLPRRFYGIGALLAVLPPNTPTGPQITSARMLGPIAGRMQAQIVVTGSGATDVLLIEA